MKERFVTTMKKETIEKLRVIAAIEGLYMNEIIEKAIDLYSEETKHERVNKVKEM